jgi:dTMP kinase
MNNQTRGVFLSLEGPDFSGKSTNLPFLAECLTAHGFKVVQTREPGGTNIAEHIRTVLLSPQIEKMDTKTELLLFAAARAQHIEQKIKPHLDLGFVVVSDRFCDSTAAYQGYGRHLLEKVRELEKFVHEGFYPDHTLFFDLPFEEGLRRMAGRPGKQDRLDQETLLFKRDVWNGYQRQFNENKHRMVRIDALHDRIHVQQQIQRWVEGVFAPRYEFLKELSV